MKCPHCGKDIKESIILQEAARINGRRSRRELSAKDAQAMAKKSAEVRRKQKEDKADGND
jgi:hypothetical protein